MKPFHFVFLLSLLAMSVLTSCKKDEDPCDNIVCQNGGTCNNGTCACATGYEGTTCGTEVRAKFFGTYNASETCAQSGNSAYQLTITSSSTGISAVIINLGVNVSGTVSGSNLTIPTQQVTIQGAALTINGSGQLTGNILTLTYTVSGPGGSDTCTATCTKL